MNADTKMKKERTSRSRSEVIAFVKQSKQFGTFLHTLITPLSSLDHFPFAAVLPPRKCTQTDRRPVSVVRWWLSGW